MQPSKQDIAPYEKWGYIGGRGSPTPYTVKLAAISYNNLARGLQFGPLISFQVEAVNVVEVFVGAVAVVLEAAKDEDLLLVDDHSVAAAGGGVA